MKSLYGRYKEIIAYLFFGVCTTLVNIISYYICARRLGFSTVAATVAAWIAAVVFAYVTNKLFVFGSQSWDRKVIAKEAFSFFACRAATGVLDVAIMYIGVDVWGFFDVGVKVFSNVLVIILNYAASKIIIFKTGR